MDLKNLTAEKLFDILDCKDDEVEVDSFLDSSLPYVPKGGQNLMSGDSLVFRPQEREQQLKLSAHPGNVTQEPSQASVTLQRGKTAEEAASLGLNYEEYHAKKRREDDGRQSLRMSTSSRSVPTVSRVSFLHEPDTEPTVTPNPFDTLDRNNDFPRFRSYTHESDYWLPPVNIRINPNKKTMKEIVRREMELEQELKEDEERKKKDKNYQAVVAQRERKQRISEIFSQQPPISLPPAKSKHKSKGKSKQNPPPFDQRYPQAENGPFGKRFFEEDETRSKTRDESALNDPNRSYSNPNRTITDSHIWSSPPRRHRTEPPPDGSPLSLPPIPGHPTRNRYQGQTYEEYKSKVLNPSLDSSSEDTLDGTGYLNPPRFTYSSSPNTSIVSSTSQDFSSDSASGIARREPQRSLREDFQSGAFRQKYE